MYREIPDIIHRLLDAPDETEHRAHVLKLLAYLKEGVPPFWPIVPRQADFTHTRPNPLIDSGSTHANSDAIAIGSPLI